MTRPSSAPGLGRAPKTEKLVRALLGDLEIPVVLDADGINALAGHMDILDGRKALTVLTPPRRGVLPDSPGPPCPSKTA